MEYVVLVLILTLLLVIGIKNNYCLRVDCRVAIPLLYLYYTIKLHFVDKCGYFIFPYIKFGNNCHINVNFL